MVVKAGRQALDQADAAVGFSQQQRTGVRGQRAAVEPCHHLAREVAFKLETVLGTLCHSGSRDLFGFETFALTNVYARVPGFPPTPV